jgi:putative ABC transport system permease protein
MFDSLKQDVGFSVRMLVRQPGFTLVALVALALGLGANTAIFSIVDAVLWRPLPYPDADRVMALAEQRPREGRLYGPVAPADFFDWRHDGRSFSSVAAYMEQSLNLTGIGEPERLRGLSVSPGFLKALGISPAFGRDLRDEEETYGRHRVVLITDALWRRRFGADAGLVGRTVTFNGNPYEVVGILPASFWWPTRPEIVVPLALDDHDRTLRGAHFLDVIARLQPGVSIARAREELNVIGARLSQTYPAENRYHSPSIRSFRDALVGDVRTALLVLLAAVGLVMLIACANVATLLLARASGRQRELSIRRAVGASRGRLVRQLLTESLVVALAGGATGVLVAAWALSAFRVLLPAQFSGLPGIEHAGLDARVLGAALALSTITGIVFGVVPAVVASDQRVGVTLKEESRGSSGSVRARRLRSGLVVAELALSLVLLAGAALLIVSFDRLTEVSPGFRPDHLWTTSITLPGSRYAEHARAAAFVDALVDRLRTMPGVQRVGATTALPFSGQDARLNLDIEKSPIESAVPVRAHPRLVSPDYFSTMGIPLLRGRTFTDADTESSPAVVVINDTAARRFWPSSDPIGRRISLGSPERWMEIVGIVGDIRHQGLDADANPEAYMPHHQQFAALGTGLVRVQSLVVRSDLDNATVARMVRTAVAAIDSQQPVGLVQPMDGLIADSVAPRRLNFLLVTAFATIALVLTAAGLYGVMAYLVTERRREIGVRMALGASPGQVLGLMLRQAGVMTVAGIVVGVLGALALTRWMTSLLFGVSAADPSIYVAVVGLLTLVALAAVAVPSMRATRIDPLIALRD